MEPDRVKKPYHGVPCHPSGEAGEVIQEQGTIAAILAVPGRVAQEAAHALLGHGNRGTWWATPTSSGSSPSCAWPCSARA